MSVGLRQIHLNFEWCSQSEVVSIGIRVLRKAYEKLSN